LQLHYPGVACFNEENFWHLPILFIEKALNEIDEKTKAIAHEMAVPISLMAQSMCAMEGVQDAKTEWFNPHERRLRRAIAVKQYEPATAGLLLQLTKEGKLPGWAMEHLDIDQVRLAAEG
jgi:hypothetical protein